MTQPARKFCPECGASLPYVEAKFCPECGASRLGPSTPTGSPLAQLPVQPALPVQQDAQPPALSGAPGGAEVDGFVDDLDEADRKLEDAEILRELERAELEGRRTSVARPRSAARRWVVGFAVFLLCWLVLGTVGAVVAALFYPPAELYAGGAFFVVGLAIGVRSVMRGRA